MNAYMYHIGHLRGAGLAEVVYACDQDPDKARQACQRYGIPSFTTDYEQLVASPEVDLALVITSMSEHAPAASAALQAGKHVLVEKPLAVTLEGAKALLDLAQNSPGYLLCAPFVMLSPTYQIIWSRLRNGEIGEVLNARARYGHAGPTWGPWYYRSGGALFDLAPYNLTSLTGWLGPVERVTAFAGTAIPERVIDGVSVQVEIEDNAGMLLDFGASRFAVVTAGFTIQQYRSPAIELYGSRGTLQMMGDDWDPEGYELFRNDVGAWTIFKETDPGWLWTDGIRYLVSCIRAGSPPLIPPQHAYHVLEVLVRAKESARDGQARAVTSAFPGYVLNEAAADLKDVHLIHDRTHQRR